MDLTIKNVPEELEKRIRYTIELIVTKHLEKQKIVVIQNESEVTASIEQFKAANAIAESVAEAPPVEPIITEDTQP